MRLRVVTPSGLVVDAANVRYVRAEDASGAFGIEPGHTEFVTTLAVSVLSFRDAHALEHHAAVRGGVLRVVGGRLVEVATREAVLGDDLNELKSAVLTRLRDCAQAEAKARTRAAQLHASVVRYLYRYVKAERTAGTRALREDFAEDSSP